MTNAEETVLAVNQSFYSAFSSSDLNTMLDLWSERDDISVIHPGWPPLKGRAAVLNSWKGIMENGASPFISCVDASVSIVDSMALVLCTEVLPQGELISSNVYVLENKQWKIMHHQAGPLPSTDDTVESDTLH